MTPIVRPATPADVEAALPLILSSGPDAFAFVFARPGAPATEFIRAAFVANTGTLGWRNHWLAEIDGRVLGSVACWGAECNLAFAASYLRHFIAYYRHRAPGVLLRGLRTETVIRPPVSGRLYLAHLGVAIDARSHGIGTALIGHVTALASSQGRSHMALDVADNNPRAQALYQGLGFEVVATRPSRLRNALGHVPGTHYMERQISPRDAGSARV